MNYLSQTFFNRKPETFELKLFKIYVPQKPLGIQFLLIKHGYFIVYLKVSLLTTKNKTIINQPAQMINNLRNPSDNYKHYNESAK